jgi:polar amino acid transport system substrate-binding protein
LGLLVLALAVLACGPLRAEPPSPEAVREIAPSGRLRAAINYGNIVLASRNQAGELSGVSVDLANALGERLGVPVDLLPFDTAGKVSAVAGQDVWDVAFLAIDPVRAGDIAFTSPYVLIEGTYAVPEASVLRTIEDVDREGAQIAVGRGSAYDLYLTRKLKRASIRRAATSEDAIKLFVEQKLDAVAGVRQPLELFAKENSAFRVVPGRFMAIEQAIGVPKGREHASRFLVAFIEKLKSNGFVAEALARHRQTDAVVAPPAPAP